MLQLHLPTQLHANASLQDIILNSTHDTILDIPPVLVAPAIGTKRLLAASSLHDAGSYCHTDVHTGRYYLQHCHNGRVVPLIYWHGLMFIFAKFHVVLHIEGKIHIELCILM